MIRYASILGLLLAAVAIPSRLNTVTRTVEAPASNPPLEVPEAVLEAQAEGRFWRASRLMDEYLSTRADTPRAEILLAARLHAGWDHWSAVGEILEGRDWLAEEERGAGLELLGRSRIALGRAEAGAEALARYLDVHDGDDVERGLTELRRGLALDAADRTPAALEALARARRLLPWMGDWASLYAAGVAASSGDTAAVRAHLAGTGGLAEGGGWRLRMRAAREAGDSMAAREIALEAARSAPAAGTRAAAWVELGRLRLAAGDRDRAKAAFLEAMESEGHGAAVDAARELTELSPGPEESRRIGAVYARHGNAQRAAEGFRAYLDAGIGTAAERARARLSLGEARYNAGRYAQAERGLLDLADDEVAPSIAARALYLAGRAQYRQGRSEEGQRTLARLAERFPDQDVAARGMYLLADLKHDDLKIDEARRYYRAAVDASPDLNEAGLSLMRLGGLAYLDGDYAGAATLYEEYRTRHPGGRRWEQATYWAARSYDAAGRAAEARTRLRELREREPLSYYGVRAAELLSEPLLGIPMIPAPARTPAADSAVEAGLRRVDLLARLDRRGDVVREVERLRDRLEDDTAAAYLLAERLTERGYTLTAIGLGWSLYRRRGGWDDRLLRVIYPFPYRGLILPESREKGLDPYLVAAIIRRESAFNPTVTSGAGAIGLMQVMPETGRTLARATSLRDFEPGLLRQPEVNVHLGTRYLAEMLDRFEHDLPLVLSAYNAGPTRARAWRELPEARDPELFTERVPYGETRDYIRNVLLHRALYRALYPTLEEPGAAGDTAGSARSTGAPGAVRAGAP